MPIDNRDWYKRKKKCPFCGYLIDAAQSRCPFCGRELPLSPRPRGPMEWRKEQRGEKAGDEIGTERQERAEEFPALQQCAVCGQMSLFWNARNGNYECLNPDCQAVGKAADAVFSWKLAVSKMNEKQEEKQEDMAKKQERVAGGEERNEGHLGEKYEERQEHRAGRQEEKQQQEGEKQLEKSSPGPGGLAKSEHVVSGRAWWGNDYYDVKKRRWRTPTTSPIWIVKLCLNLLILVGLGFLIVFGYRVFTQQTEPLKNAIVLILGITAWILIIRLSRSRRFRWVRPSFKLTAFSVISILLILSFAGVQPFSGYKDSLFSSISGYFRNAGESDATPWPSDTAVSPSNEINSRTGEYEDYYLGLVGTPGGYLSGNGCYDDTGNFIVLINSEDAANPSYSQLVSFLREDSTDQFPYIYAAILPGVYYGRAESHVNLERIQGIIDGTGQPTNPHVCADFAERLHNNAELAGIRCGYVSITLAGDKGHACDAFQTTDRGLIYVDVTGWRPDQPHPDRAVSTVSIVIGRSYTPVSLFREAGWEDSYVSMGTVTSFQVVWDGTWNN